MPTFPLQRTSFGHLPIFFMVDLCYGSDFHVPNGSATSAPSTSDDPPAMAHALHRFVPGDLHSNWAFLTGQAGHNLSIVHSRALLHTPAILNSVPTALLPSAPANNFFTVTSVYVFSHLQIFTSVISMGVLPHIAISLSYNNGRSTIYEQTVAFFFLPPISTTIL
eukprot:Gb_19974 [translate_table: standard]